MVSIRRSQVFPRRHWMVRNYLVTLSPITFRILLQAQLAMGQPPPPKMIATLPWLIWLAPLRMHEAGSRIYDRIRTAEPGADEHGVLIAPGIDAPAQ